MKIGNFKLKIVKRGFTLIELLVAVAIFMVIFAIVASMVNLAAGSTKSARTKLLTTDLRNALEIINQKMNSANAKADATPPIYGFRVDGKILGIAQDVSGSVKCAFIGLNAANRIMMLEKDNCTSWPSVAELTQPLTPETIKVTKFDFSPKNQIENLSSSITQAPQLKIIIEAEDTDPKYASDNKITLQTGYTLDYQAIQGLKAP